MLCVSSDNHGQPRQEAVELRAMTARWVKLFSHPNLCVGDFTPSPPHKLVYKTDGRELNDLQVGDVIALYGQGGFMGTLSAIDEEVFGT